MLSIICRRPLPDACGQLVDNMEALEALGPKA